MTDQANISPITRSAQLAPRVAHAIQAGKLAAQRRERDAGGDATAVAAASQPGTQVPTFDLLDSRVELHIDKESGLVVGRVFDKQTNEQIRQIPAETMVRLVAALKKELGPLVNIKA